MPQTTDDDTKLRSRLRTKLAAAAMPLVDFVLPPACAFCKRDLENDDEAVDGIRLCERCRKNFTSDQRSACLKCGMSVGPYVDTKNGCLECSRRHFRFTQVIRLGVYEDNLRTACIRGKSRGAEPLAAALASFLWKRQQDRLQEFSPDVVISVPQYWLHWFTRPHHQAQTMAEVLAERLTIPCDERAVRKVRRTVDQSSLPRSKRLKNLEHAFRTRRGIPLKNKRVLLVDDILTTGTTSNEVARVLLRAGASSVAVAVIAVVP